MLHDLLRGCAVIAVLSGAGWLHTASAQDAETSISEEFGLGKVEITAKARGRTLGGSTIGAEELRVFDKLTLDRAMDLIPGAAESNTGGSRNERLIFIRGFDRFQTTLSIDGVRVFLPADNRIDFGRFLTADLSAIQVSKGYVSVLDGPGAIGGAINLVTRKPARALEAELSGNASFDRNLGSNGYTVSGLVGTRQNQFYLQASGALNERDYWKLSDDFDPTALEDGGRRNNSRSEDWRINVKAGFTPNDRDEYALSYTRQSGDKNAPYHIADTASTRYWSWPYWDIDSLYFLSNTAIGDGGYLKTRIYLNSFENALFSYDDPAQTTQSLPRAFRSYYDDQAYGANLQAGMPVSGSNLLRVAFHYRRDEHKEQQDGFTRAGTANIPYSEPWQTTREDTFSIAVEDTQSFGEKWDLIVGLSYDWTDLKRAEDVNTSVVAGSVVFLPVNYPLRNSEAFNWQAALSYEVSDSARVHVSVSSRERFPTLFERFSSRFGTAVPNPDIGPERATNFEIGGSADPGGGAHLEGALFYSDVTDALLSVPVPFGPPLGTLNQTRNVGDGEYYGLEFAIAVPLGDTISLGGNYTYLHRDIDDPTNAAFHPTGVPEHKLFAYLNWQPAAGLTVTPNLEWTSDRWTVTSSSLVVPPVYYKTGDVVLLNLAIDWAATDHLDALIGARNLLDEDYQLVDGFPEEGRSFYIGLRLKH